MSEQLRRCVHLFDMYAVGAISPAGYPLSPLRLENLLRAIVTEGGPAEPPASIADLIAEARSYAAILATLREVPHD